MIGEMSLENDMPRNATGICIDEVVEMLMVTKKDYNEMFADILMEERNVKMDLINNVIPEVKQYSKAALTS